MKYHTQSPQLIAIMLLLIAVAGMPYGYYTFLRIVVTLAACWQIAVACSTGGRSWLPFAAIAVLFNPIVPIYLPREIWVVLDLIVAVLFGCAVYANRRSRLSGLLSIREGEKDITLKDSSVRGSDGNE